MDNFRYYKYTHLIMILIPSCTLLISLIVSEPEGLLTRGLLITVVINIVAIGFGFRMVGYFMDHDRIEELQGDLYRRSKRLKAGFKVISERLVEKELMSEEEFNQEVDKRLND